MALADYDFSLSWPRELFLWEGKRIARLKSDQSFTNMVATFFDEAFADGDIAASLERVSPGDDAGTVLSGLISDPGQLHDFEPPRYWLERTVGVAAAGDRAPLSGAFADLVLAMRSHNYFPKVLPEQCVDDHGTWEADPSDEISRAIHVRVNWPLQFEDGSVSDDVLFSTIEYFHDQAQRARTRWFHQFGDCGYHHIDHNKESGAVVYRWRVNDLLNRYGVDLKIAGTGPEKGHIVRHSGLSLDPLADELATAKPGVRGEEGTVADAIRLFRSRSSTHNQRRAAVTQLAGVLESHRQELKALQFSSADESDLFKIFNNFGFRHNNKVQKSDYGDEYLDWVFWVTLAAIHLMRQLDKSARIGAQPSGPRQ